MSASTRLSLLRSTAAMLATLACAAPIFYAHRESPRTLVSAHGLLHTAIAQRFDTTSLLAAPPENPFFAGARVPYYWFFQYCGARLGRLLSMHPLHAFEGMILASVAIAWLTAGALGGRVYGGTAPGLALGLLVFGGTNPFGVVILLGKMLLRGTGPLRDDPNHLWGIAHPMMSAARLNDPYDLYGPPINFFFNITARPLGIVFLLVMALCLLGWLQRGSATSWIQLVLATALCTAFSFPFGAPGALTLSAGLLVAVGLPEGSVESAASVRQWRRRALSAVIALVAGTCLAAPTYLHLLFGEAERDTHIDLSLSTLLRTGMSAGLILCMALIGALRSDGAARRFLVAVLIAGAILVGAGTFLVLPVQNHCNLFQAGALLLAVPAVGTVVPAPNWSIRRAQLTWLSIMILFLPTVLLVMVAYLHRPPLSLTLTHRHLQRVPADSPLARLYAWVQQHTASDAIFILDPGPPFTTAVGNMPEFPALTERVVFTSYRTSYMVAPHRDAGLRQQIATQLLAGAPLDPRQASYLTELRRPLYLVAEFPGGSALSASLTERFGSPAFRAENIAIFAVDPTRTLAQSLPGAA